VRVKHFSTLPEESNRPTQPSHPCLGRHSGTMIRLGAAGFANRYGRSGELCMAGLAAGSVTKYAGLVGT